MFRCILDEVWAPPLSPPRKLEQGLDGYSAIRSHGAGPRVQGGHCGQWAVGGTQREYNWTLSKIFILSFVEGYLKPDHNRSYDHT